jgi:hypothetical protein
MFEEGHYLKNALFNPQMTEVGPTQRGRTKNDGTVCVSIVAAPRQDRSNSSALDAIELVKREGA